MSFFEGKKVLVAGGAGLIGSHTIEGLLARGADVVATIRNKPPVIEDPRVEYRKVDLATREGCVTAAEGCAMTIMAAADTSGAYMMRHNPMTHVTENVLINSLLLEASWKAGAERILFCSTTTIYPDVDYEVKEEEGFVGDPHPVYFGVGWMKRYIEKLMAFYQQKFDTIPVILRPTNIYGPRDKFDFERSHVLPALIRRALELEEGQPMEVWGDGSAVRDFVYITDFVEGMLTALERCTDGEPINIGSGTATSIKEAVELILKLTGREANGIEFAPDKPTSIQKRVVDLSRARERLGWDPQVSFEEGVRRTIEWFQAHPEAAKG